MNRDYTLTSPSLTGLLQHDSVVYNGIARTSDIRSIFDRPKSLVHKDLSDPKKREMVERYMSDLYTVFIKRLTTFSMDSDPTQHESVALQAMLQEFIKVKNMLAENR